MKDLTGQRFGRLIVVSFEGRTKQYDSLWQCHCDCENELTVRGGHLKNGHTQSCGCLQKEKTSEAHIVHSLYYDKETGRRSKLYKVWGSMKERCNNQNSDAFKYYGARGIEVDNDWSKNYLAFYDWAMGSGYKEGLTIERINNDGNYEPSNCTWIPGADQSKNKRSTKLLTFCGDTKKLPEWADIVDIPADRIRDRLRKGWTIERALITKLNKRWR